MSWVEDVPHAGNVSLTFFTTFGKTCQGTREALEKVTFMGERPSTTIDYKGTQTEDGLDDGLGAKERWRMASVGTRPASLSLALGIRR